MEWHSHRKSLSWVPATRTQNTEITELLYPYTQMYPSCILSSCALHTSLGPMVGFGLGPSCLLLDYFSVSRWVLAAFIWVAASPMTQSSHWSQGLPSYDWAEVQDKFSFLRWELAACGWRLQQLQLLMLRKTTQTKECSFKEFSELN